MLIILNNYIFFICNIIIVESFFTLQWRKIIPEPSCYVIKYKPIELTMEISRNKNQDLAMMLIYESLTYVYMDIEFDIEKLISNHLEMNYDEVDLFIKQTVIKSLINKDEIIEDIQKKMPNWKFDRINRLAQAILLQAVTHYRYVEKVDKTIVIDNAVKLAKKYLDEGDYRFINAVLDSVL